MYETLHRVFVSFRPEDRDRIAEALARTFGIVSFCEALRIPKEIAAIEEGSARLAAGFIAAGLGKRFKAEVRRAEKTFPLTSYEIACRVGDLLLERFPELKVDVHQPDWVLTMEIREYAYLYGPEIGGPTGCPAAARAGACSCSREGSTRPSRAG